MALDRKGGIKSVCVDDEFAMRAALLFAGEPSPVPASPIRDRVAPRTDEHKMLVELACATTLAPAYSPALFAKLVPPGGNVVFVVCGGFKVSLAELEEYRGVVEEKTAQCTHWDVLCNGERWEIPM